MQSPVNEENDPIKLNYVLIGFCMLQVALSLNREYKMLNSMTRIYKEKIQNIQTYFRIIQRNLHTSNMVDFIIESFL
jgi:hypothetical protein